MENLIDLEQKTLISELNQGKELAKQLWNQLQPSSSSQEAGILLIEKILTSYEKALSVLNTVAFAEETKSSFTPRNGVFKQDVKDKDVFKKRKLMPKWSEQVKICSGTGFDGPLDDGYNWRKYGQKDILGAKFPRSYYRCSHRFGQGCLATKQVQKSDEDSTIYEITYKGRHTCNQIPHSEVTPLTKETINHHKKHPQQEKIQPEHEENPMIFNFGEDEVRVKPEKLDMESVLSPLFGFPSTSIGSEMRENFSAIRRNEFTGSFSPTFQSPSTSESEYFHGLCHMNDQSFDSELAEFISIPNSVTKIGDLEEYYTSDEFFI